MLQKSTREGKIMYGTIWALLPPVVAIVLALITKEVYSSLFIGIVTGALIYTGFSPYCNAGYGDQRRIYQFRGGCMEYRYLHVPDPVGYHGSTDEQGRRLCSLRRMGEKHVKTRAGALLSTFY